MELIKNTTVYKCEYCNKKMFRKGDMTRHERDYCKSNPKNQDACLGCKFCEKKEVEYPSIYEDDWGYSGMIKSHAYRCTKLKKLMYPFKARKHAKKYPHTFKGQERMPTECKSFISEIATFFK